MPTVVVVSGTKLGAAKQIQVFLVSKDLCLGSGSRKKVLIVCCVFVQLIVTRLRVVLLLYGLEDMVKMLFVLGTKLCLNFAGLVNVPNVELDDGRPNIIRLSTARVSN